MRRIYPVDLATARRYAEERKRLGLTQLDVALATGWSSATVSQLETGRTPLSPQHREALDRVLRAAEQPRELAAD